VDLEVRTNSIPAIKLYEHAGFRHVGIAERGMRHQGIYYDVAMMGMLL